MCLPPCAHRGNACLSCNYTMQSKFQIKEGLWTLGTGRRSQVNPPSGVAAKQSGPATDRRPAHARTQTHYSL